MASVDQTSIKSTHASLGEEMEIRARIDARRKSGMISNRVPVPSIPRRQAQPVRPAQCGRQPGVSQYTYGYTSGRVSAGSIGDMRGTSGRKAPIDRSWLSPESR